MGLYRYPEESVCAEFNYGEFAIKMIDQDGTVYDQCLMFSYPDPMHLLYGGDQEKADTGVGRIH